MRIWDMMWRDTGCVDVGYEVWGARCVDMGCGNRGQVETERGWGYAHVMGK